MKTKQISQNQLFLFMILYFYSTLVGFSAAQLIQSSQYDSLLVLCISGVAGGIYTIFIIKLANRRPNEFFVHYGSEIFPKWIHILFTGFYFFTFLHISAFILREYEDFIVQTYLSETPNWAVGAILGMVVAITARLGIQTIFRTAQGLFFLILIASAMNTFFVGKELKWIVGLPLLPTIADMVYLLAVTLPFPFLARSWYWYLFSLILLKKRRRSKPFHGQSFCRYY